MDRTACRLGSVYLLGQLTKEECAVSMAGVGSRGGVALTVSGLARSLGSRFPKLQVIVVVRLAFGIRLSQHSSAVLRAADG